MDPLPSNEYISFDVAARFEFENKDERGECLLTVGVSDLRALVVGRNKEGY